MSSTLVSDFQILNGSADQWSTAVNFSDVSSSGEWDVRHTKG